MGRSGKPFACEWSGVRPDLLTTAKALAGGFPAGAVLASGRSPAAFRWGSFGTTFGGAPVASALIATVIRVIREQDLLSRVCRLSDRIRTEAVVGPVRRVQGRGFLLGLACSRPAKEVRNALLERGIFAGVSTDPAALRLMPPLVLEDEHVDALVAALRDIPAEKAAMREVHKLEELGAAAIREIVALAARLRERPEPRALEGKVLALLFLNPSLRTQASFQAAMTRLGGGSFVIAPDRFITSWSSIRTR